MRTIFSQPELVNTQRVNIAKAQRISVDYIFESISIHMIGGDVLVLEEYLTEADPKLFARVTSDPDGVTIRHGERLRLFNPLRGFVRLYLPRSYYGVLNLKTISGKIEARDRLVLSELAFSSTSGRISLGDVTAGTAVLTSVSGSIDVESLKALATVHTTSGSIHVDDAAGAGEFTAISGSIEIPFHAVTGNITANTISGRVRVYLPAALSFSLSAQNVSGGISVPFEGNFSGGKHSLSGTAGRRPRVHVAMRSVSGRLEALPLG